MKPGTWNPKDFPRLNSKNSKITSAPTRRYNCIAWAAGEDRYRFDPHPQYRWPKGVIRELSINAVLSLYEGMGYSLCIGGHLESGTEKVAVYGITNHEGRKLPTHAARQLETGEWTSKLGDHEDISHNTPESVGGGLYGEPLYFLSRPRPEPGQPSQPPSSTVAI
jgi:hypothetical protein